MPLLIALSFIIVFALAVFFAFAIGGNGSERKEKARLLLESVTSPVRDSSEPHLDIRKRESFSSIPWLNQKLLDLDLTHRLQLLLTQANLRWTPSRFLLGTSALVAFSWYLIYLRTGAGMISFLAGITIGLLPLYYVFFKRSQQMNAFERLLPDAIGHMVSALRAGQSLNAAFQVAMREVPDPVGREFRICADEQNFGLELRTAMHNLTNRVPLADLQMVATAILIQRESGGNLAEILEKTATVIRERFRLQRQIRVHTAQGRLTGWILAGLPAFLGFGLYLLAPDRMSLLWTRDIGVDLLWGALLMNLIGLWIIRRIVKIRF